MLASSVRASTSGAVRRAAFTATTSTLRTSTPASSRWISSSAVRFAAAGENASSNGAAKKSSWLTFTTLTVLAGSAGYYLFSPALLEAKTKEEAANKKQAPKMNSSEAPLTDAAKKEKLKDTTVIFVLGGPGAGKGTQCANLVRDFGFVHLSAGDLLRAEQERPGSQYGDMIKTYIREGKIVPMEVTIALLENAMLESGQDRFLIDGFPRKMDQALKFEEVVVPSKFTLYFECPEEVMLGRLMKRGETSGRIDDNIESIKKRFKVFTETSYPVIEYFGKEGKVHKVSCTSSPEGVYKEVKEIFNKLFGENK